MDPNTNFHVCEKTDAGSWTQVDNCHVNIKAQPPGCSDTFPTVAHHIMFVNGKDNSGGTTDWYLFNHGSNKK